jgi:hypothetical protein
MTTPDANLPEKEKNLPLFWAPKDQSGKVNGVVLWLYTPLPLTAEQEVERTAKEAAFKVANPGKELPGVPQMTGYLIRDDSRTEVSAWVKNGENGAFSTLTKRNQKQADGSYDNSNLGNGNAVNTEGKDAAGVGIPLPANRVPYVLFNVEGKAYRAMANASAVDYMIDMGFKEEVIANFETKLKEPKKSAAAKP